MNDREIALWVDERWYQALSKIMGRKWRCNGAAGCPRGPPSPFPAVCPCAAVCAHSVGRVASVHLARVKRGVGPFVRRCGEL